jgi:hypothetical protein
LRILGGAAETHFLERGIEHAARDEHGGPEPVRQGRCGTEGQQASRGAQAIIAPTDVAELQEVARVLRIERESHAPGDRGFFALPVQAEDKRQRAPRVAGHARQLARDARVPDAMLQRRDVRSRVDRRRFVRQATGSGEADMRIRIARRPAHRARPTRRTGTRGGVPCL